MLVEKNFPDHQNCYEDFPVKFELENRNITGFLTKNEIIRSTSHIISCNKIDVITLPRSHIQIIKEGNLIKIEANRRKTIELNINNKNIAHISFAHSNILSSGYDLFADLERYTKNEDNDDIFYTQDNKNIDVSAKIKEEIEQIKQRSTSWIKWLLIIGLNT